KNSRNRRVALGWVGIQVVRNGLQLGERPLRSLARFQPPDYWPRKEVARSDPDLKRIQPVRVEWEFKTLGHDAHNRMSGPVELDGPRNNVRIAAEARSPQPVTDDDHWAMAPIQIFRQEGAAE